MKMWVKKMLSEASNVSVLTLFKQVINAPFPLGPWVVLAQLLARRANGLPPHSLLFCLDGNTTGGRGRGCSCAEPWGLAYLRSNPRDDLSCSWITSDRVRCVISLDTTLSLTIDSVLQAWTSGTGAIPSLRPFPESKCKSLFRLLTPNKSII